MAAQLTAQQKSIVNAAKNGHSIFFTGYAGTGKSFVIRHLLKVLPKNGLFPTSSTGISAVPLGAMTLHSYSGIGNSSAADSVIINRALNNQNARERITMSKIIIIDEISMISMRLFDLISKICMIIRGIDYPFGGIQVIAVGDDFQLAPVKGPYDEGKYSFLSTNWNILFPITHCFFLTKIFRQDNLDDIELLNDVREIPGCQKNRSKD